MEVASAPPPSWECARWGLSFLMCRDGGSGRFSAETYEVATHPSSRANHKSGWIGEASGSTRCTISITTSAADNHGGRFAACSRHGERPILRGGFALRLSPSFDPGEVVRRPVHFELEGPPAISEVVEDLVEFVLGGFVLYHSLLHVGKRIAERTAPEVGCEFLDLSVDHGERLFDRRHLLGGLGWLLLVFA